MNKGNLTSRVSNIQFLIEYMAQTQREVTDNQELFIVNLIKNGTVVCQSKRGDLISSFIMPYSLDLREKVISLIDSGHSITKTAKTFGIGRSTIYRWLNRPELAPTQVTTRKRKIDTVALAKDVERDASTPLKERAQRFGVTPAALLLRLTKAHEFLKYYDKQG